jgi:hypothetical protein
MQPTTTAAFKYELNCNGGANTEKNQDYATQLACRVADHTNAFSCGERPNHTCGVD